MICGDIRSAIVLMDMRLDEAQEAARSQIVARELGGGPRASVRQRLCRLLYSLGHGLVAVGKYLERSDLSEQSL